MGQIPDFWEKSGIFGGYLGGSAGMTTGLGVTGTVGVIVDGSVGLGWVINQPVAPIAISRTRPIAPRRIGFLVAGVSSVGMSVGCGREPL